MIGKLASALVIIVFLACVPALAVDVALERTFPVDSDGAKGTSEVVVFSADGSLLAAGNKQGQAVVYRVADGSEVRRLILTTDLVSQKKAGEVECLAFSPDASLLVAGGNLGNMKVFRVSDGSEVAAFPHGQTDGMTWNRKGTILAVGDGGWVKLYDTTDWTMPRGYKYGGYNVNSIAWSKDDDYIIVGGADADGVARIYRVSGGEFSVRSTGMPEKYHSIKSVRLSRDGKTFATANADDWSVKLVNYADGKLIKRIAQDGYMEAVEFTTDGKYLLTGGKSGILRFYRTSDWELVKEVPAHSASIEYIDVSSDGKRIATSSEDGTAKLWVVDASAADTVITPTFATTAPAK